MWAPTGIKSYFHTCLIFLLRAAGLLWMWTWQGEPSLPGMLCVERGAKVCMQNLTGAALSPRPWDPHVRVLPTPRGPALSALQPGNPQLPILAGSMGRWFLTASCLSISVR